MEQKIDSAEIIKPKWRDMHDLERTQAYSPSSAVDYDVEFFIEQYKKKAPKPTMF